MYSMDVMDDLFDMAEDPTGMDFGDDFEAMDDFAADDGFDDFEAEDDFEAYDDEFDEMEGFDEFDLYDDYDEFAGDDFDTIDLADAMEDIVADALDAEDMDEFFGKIFKGLKKIGKKALRSVRRAAPFVGKLARGVGSIASLIPHPYAKAIGGAANIVGRLMADDADEFEAIDALADYADYDEELDAAAPIIAGLAIRKTMPNAGNLPKSQRKKLVKSVSRPTRKLVQQQGGKAAKAMPGIVHQAKKTARRTGQPVTQAIARTTAKVAKRPAVTRKLARPVVVAAKGRTKTLGRSRGTVRRQKLRGPAEVIIRGR